ncbi:alpha/beta fold hydrolase [Nonomuraea thailandensis]
MSQPAPTLAAGSVGVVETRHLDLPEPVRLDCGRELHPVRVAYETYGALSPRRDNVILVCHALSGDAHAAGLSKAPSGESTRDGFGAADRDGAGGKGLGWWDGMIGPGKAFDTDRYFVISTNLLGGCRGTTGPSSIDPATGLPYGPDFPVITVADMVRTQRAFLDVLGIERLAAVAGGSLGGMQALEWAVLYPGQVDAVVAIAGTHALHPQGWPGTRSRVTRSCAIRPGRAAATTARAARPTPAWASGGWSATSPTCPRPRWRPSSAGGCRAPTRSATRSPRRSSRWRAICATRPTRSSGASTPTPTSTPPAR